MSARLLIVGAGFTGAVLARRLKDAGHRVLVIDERDHVAGNCHTARDAETGIMVHRYGPHIFHTDNREVWEYVQRFARFRPYVNRVKTIARGRVYSLPLNLHTLNQLWGECLSPDAARARLAAQSVEIEAPANFEEQALALVGRDLYETFFEGYTTKQWGVSPRRLPASILKRLPIRFNYDDNYFAHRYQGIPEEGYTTLIERMLQGVEIRLSTPFEEVEWSADHVFYAGPIDRYFGHVAGRLGYRSLRFEEIRAPRTIQGNAVINYADGDIPWTRISEHKYFAPWELQENGPSIAYREFPQDCAPGDIPYYPLRLVDDKAMLTQYETMARQTKGVSFVGRLGTYRYLDMDRCIAEAMDVADQAILRLAAGQVPSPLHQAAA